MRNISSWSIKNPIPVILLFLLLTIAGIAGFRSMRINNNPDVDLPIVVVTAVRPGAAPSELETQVTRLIEDSIAGLGQVRHTNSTIVDGASTTVIEFELGVDHERVTNDVRNAMSNLRGDLPQDMQEPTVTRVDISGDDLITYVVKAPTLTPEQRSWFVDNDVSRALLAIRGVGEVNRRGGVNREIEVALDPDRLAARGVTAAAVSQALVSSNADLPGGRVTISGAERAIRTLGAAGSVEQLRETRVPLPSGGAVRLADLGQVTDHWAEPRSRARFDGQEVVTFSMIRSRGASEVQTAEKVRKAVEKLDKEHPEVEIEEITSNVKYIEESYLASMEALIIGAILAVLVVLLFLRDWRATLLAAVAIPTSLLPTFAVLAPMGQSLNGVTLLALSLTVGILVDDAIVEIENIVRHMRGGKSPYAAAMEAADEIGLAVVATTFTIVAVFAPVGFMPGIIGQFFKAFALAACISVLFSLVVARLLTPLMGAYMLKADHKHEDKDPSWMGPYLKSLNWGLNNRWKVLLMGIPLFLVSIFLATRLPFEFQPQADRGRAEFSVELPPGATLDETDAIVRRVTKELLARQEVLSVYASVGRNNAVNKGAVTADLTDKGQRISQQQFSRQMVDQFAAIPGARIGAGSNNGGGPSSGGTYTLSLVSDNGPALEAAARKVEAEMRTVPGLAHVVNTAAIARPEIVVTPRPDQAARAGVSAGAISQAVRVATIGDVDQNLPKYNLGDRQVPIRLRLNDDARGDIAVLQTLQVPSADGAVPLNAVADVRFGAGPSQIDRRDRSRVATITAERGRHPRPRPAVGQEPAARRQGSGRRRRRVHPGDGQRLPGRADHRHPADVRRAGAAVPQLRPPGHHHGRPAAGHRRRLRPAGAGQVQLLDLDPDRDPDADGHRRQELDPAGRVRDHGDEGARHGQAHGHHGRRPQAGAADPDDHRGHGRGHAAHRRRPGRRGRVPGPDGDRRHRRPDHLDPAVAALHPGGVHPDGRAEDPLGTADAPDVRPPAPRRRAEGGGVGLRNRHPGQARSAPSRDPGAAASRLAPGSRIASSRLPG
jgi:HAE1 family hydrophobic/amphiphilic exporter-1